MSTCYRAGRHPAALLLVAGLVAGAPAVLSWTSQSEDAAEDASRVAGEGPMDEAPGASHSPPASSESAGPVAALAPGFVPAMAMVYVDQEPRLAVLCTEGTPPTARTSLLTWPIGPAGVVDQQPTHETEVAPGPYRERADVLSAGGGAWLLMACGITSTGAGLDLVDVASPQSPELTHRFHSPLRSGSGASTEQLAAVAAEGLLPAGGGLFGPGSEVYVCCSPGVDLSRWLEPVPLGRGILPAVAIAPSGGAVVSYSSVGEAPASRGLRSGRILMSYSPDGESWSHPKPSVDEGSAHSSALAVDDESGLILVYTADRRAGWPLFAARSMDNGETWGRPVMLTEPTVYAFRPDAMLHDGVLYVAYLGMPTPPTREGSASELADPEGAYLLTVDPATLPVAGE